MCIKKKQYEKPDGWEKVDTYENKKNGFYAEAYKNNDEQIVLVYRGTDTTNGINELRKDLGADLRMLFSKMPEQAQDAYKAYNDLYNKHRNVIVAGYSLGGSLAQIICNETGAEGITYAAYGVGDIVEPKHTNQITNFGHESDPIYNINFKKQIGETYVIPDERDLIHKGSSKDMDEQTLKQFVSQYYG